MAVAIPKHASATWRAIVAGRQALKTGLVKRIGDGSSVSTWHDSWIPGLLSLRPSAQIGNANIPYVADLIDAETGSWKIELVRQNFTAPEADAILNIPLSVGGGADSWAWAAEKSGNYTVKSAYRALVTHNEHSALGEGTVTESSENQKQCWSRLWKLKVVPKVRVFWWRVLQKILPVESTLKHRHITQLARCKVCLDADEDLYHALIKCTHAKMFWREAREWLSIKLLELHPSTWSKDM